MSMVSMTASISIWYASTTSMRAAAGYMPRLSRSDFQQTMVSNRPQSGIGQHPLELGAVLRPVHQVGPLTPRDSLLEAVTRGGAGGGRVPVQGGLSDDGIGAEVAGRVAHIGGAGVPGEQG